MSNAFNSVVKFFVLFLVIMFLLIGCKSGSDDNGGGSTSTSNQVTYTPNPNFAPAASGLWQMFGNDARHTGRSSNTIANQIGIAWNSVLGTASGYTGVTGLVVSSDGTIYAGHIDHYLYAINWLDGSVKWKYMTENEILYSPALDSKGNIYVGSDDGFIYCVNTDGALKWKFELDSAVSSPPVVSSQNVVYVTTESKIYAFSSEGSSLWKETNDGGKTYDGLSFSAIQSSPAVDANGTIYVSAIYNYVLSFCAINSDGSLKWSLSSLPEIGFSSPTVGDNGIVYVVGGHIANQGQYNLFAVNPDGTLLWTYTFDDTTYLNNPAIGPDGTIYVACGDWYIYAIKPDGTLKWKYMLSGPAQGYNFAIDSSGVVLVKDSGSSFHTLLAIQPDGTLKWKYEPANVNALLNNPVITSYGRIYMGHTDGVIALDGQ